jgi:hypothetical protein
MKSSLAYWAALSIACKTFPLKGSVERLDNAMLRKEMAKACEKMGIKSIPKTGTNTDGILLLTQEWSRSTHELLIISLD